jgi:GNAT superfamily N-acetyltransferase
MMRWQEVEIVKLHWRHEVCQADIAGIRQLTAGTGVFSAEEIQVAGELVESRLQHGESSGYYFLLATSDDRIIAYTCYGNIPFTDRRYDLYWIAVDRDFQKHGLGRDVLKRTEQLIQAAGGLRVYAETSGRAQYASTHQFYERNGYQKIAELDDFYKSGDSKIIYCKFL